MANSGKRRSGRRGFLKRSAAGLASVVAQPPLALAAQVASPQNRSGQTREDSDPELRTVGRPGSDFMVDVIKSLGIEYIFAMPGSSFAGFHESVINYGGNKSPEYITCMHEESSVAMANGYAKIEGKPVMICAHGTVGLQHAAMAIYDAFCDRVPVYIMLGNTLDATRRGGEVGWVHSVQDAAAMVRDIVKWDDTPVSLAHFAESAVRAYKIATTPPMAPVVIVADTELQNRPIPSGENLRIPKLSITTPPAGDAAAVDEIAKFLVAADNPVLVASRCARTPSGLKSLVELAELLKAGVVDQRRRMNFPTRHPLNLTQLPRTNAATANADLILGLESSDFYSAVQPRRRNTSKDPARIVSISSADLPLRSNYQDFQRYAEADFAVAADAEATLPALIEACKRLLTADRKRAFEARGANLAEMSREAREIDRDNAAFGWDASPISTARLAAELWAQIRSEDWSLLSDTVWTSHWPLRLWDFTKHYQYIGGAGGEGVGYMAPATIGGAFANKRHGRFSLAIQSDGDLMCANGVLWTAAHHRIPILTVMHNNRAYHMEVMGLQGLANRRQRGIDRIHIGTKIQDPNIDYAKIAQGMGWRAEGPISDPRELAGAIRRGIEVVKSGEPYLIDVITQPR
jgi:acetolactate synthase I/II/III large subunit